LAPRQNVISVSFKRLSETLRDISQYRELFKYLIAFLIYIDGIGTIIGVAAIYGAELGFGSIELVLALLLVQFVGIPYSLIFGRLPSRLEKRRPFYLAFVLFNLIALPLGGILGARSLSTEITGMPPPPFESTATAVGEGIYLSTNDSIAYTGLWETIAVSAEELGMDSGADYRVTSDPGARFEIDYVGRRVEVVYSTGPDRGIWGVLMDGAPLIAEDTGQPVMIDAYNATVRYGVSQTFAADTSGEHTLSLVNTGEKNPQGQGTVMAMAQVEILPPLRQSSLGLIIALIFGIQLLGLILALLLGPGLFSGLADRIDTKHAILLALVMYTAIALWGFFLNSVIEFWFLAWMVAVVQGGSQALSRSLFSNMSPASKSGEFFGLFGIMEKFSAIFGPLIFAFAATQFGSSRPAVLSIIFFFIVGGYLLTRVDVAEGRRVAQAEDAALLRGVPGV
jgi:MFS-type transporter involved in bile tolerance (Atg22 family)